MAKAHEGWIAEILAGVDTAEAESLIALLSALGVNVRGAQP